VFKAYGAISNLDSPDASAADLDLELIVRVPQECHFSKSTRAAQRFAVIVLQG
jgi:hypothetical protein